MLEQSVVRYNRIVIVKSLLQRYTCNFNHFDELEQCIILLLIYYPLKNTQSLPHLLNAVWKRCFSFKFLNGVVVRLVLFVFC